MTQTPPNPENLGWDVERHGRMADFATDPDAEPATVPYEPTEGQLTLEVVPSDPDDEPGRHAAPEDE